MFAVPPPGTKIAGELRESSQVDSLRPTPPETVADVLSELAATKPTQQVKPIVSAAGQLGVFLGLPLDQIQLNSLLEVKDDFRAFLIERRFAYNTVRSYTQCCAVILKRGKALGWDPLTAVPKAWKEVFASRAIAGCMSIALSMSSKYSRPEDVTEPDCREWKTRHVEKGFALSGARKQITKFWRLLESLGRTEQKPLCLIRGHLYGIRLKDFPSPLREEMRELVRWKQAAYEPTRPPDAKHRPVSSKLLVSAIERLFGYTQNTLGDRTITSVRSLLVEELVGKYVAWGLNERRLKGRALRHDFNFVGSIFKQHPTYADFDLQWLFKLADGIPDEGEDELRARKAERYVEYPVLLAVPNKIRKQAGRRGETELQKAQAMMEALLLQWFLILPWRQRNIRECRIGGPRPNVVKAVIPPFAEIKRPEWVKSKEREDSHATFWQFRFSREETKTGRPIHALVPRQLIQPLEEYLEEFRPRLLRGNRTQTLFLNDVGNELADSTIGLLVSTITARHAGRLINPHGIRDIVAYGWLDKHPQDYLNVSKMLWHANINTTLRIYAGRFNESNGAVAMEEWLDELGADFTLAA